MRDTGGPPRPPGELTHCSWTPHTASRTVMGRASAIEALGSHRAGISSHQGPVAIFSRLPRLSCLDSTRGWPSLSSTQLASCQGGSGRHSGPGRSLQRKPLCTRALSTQAADRPPQPSRGALGGALGPSSYSTHRLSAHKPCEEGNPPDLALDGLEVMARAPRAAVGLNLVRTLSNRPLTVPGLPAVSDK